MQMNLHNDTLTEVTVSHNGLTTWVTIEFREGKVTWFTEPGEIAKLARLMQEKLAEEFPVTDLLPEVDDSPELERVLQSLDGAEE